MIKKPKQARKNLITFKINDEEKQRLQQMTEKSQFSSVASFIRSQLFQEENNENMLRESLRILRIWEDRK